MATQEKGLVKALGTRDIFMAGVGLVVAASTLVSDFIGWFAAGRAFAVALLPCSSPTCSSVCRPPS